MILVRTTTKCCSSRLLDWRRTMYIHANCICSNTPIFLWEIKCKKLKTQLAELPSRAHTLCVEMRQRYQWNCCGKERFYPVVVVQHTADSYSIDYILSCMRQAVITHATCNDYASAVCRRRRSSEAAGVVKMCVCTHTHYSPRIENGPTTPATRAKKNWSMTPDTRKEN